MKNDQPKNYFQLIYRLFVCLVSVGVIWIIWPFVSNVVLMLVFAFLFTTVLLSFVDALERKVHSRALSVFLVTLGVMAVAGIFIGIFISELSSQASEFSSRLDSATLKSEFTNIKEKFLGSIPEFALGFLPSDEDLASTFSSLINAFGSNLASLAGAIGNFFMITAMTLIFTIILLAEYHTFRKTLVGYFSNKYFEVGLKLTFNIEKSVASYLRGQFLSAASVAVLSVLGLVVLNLAGANLTLIVFIGIIAGLANLIPLIGPFVGMVPAILIAFMNNLGSEEALSHLLFGVVPSPFFIFDIILMFFIVQQIEGTFITPTLVGKSVGIHPMVVMIALIIGGTILGPLGMLFAVPTAGVIKVICQEIAFVRRNAHLL